MRDEEDLAFAPIGSLPVGLRAHTWPLGEDASRQDYCTARYARESLG